MADGVETADTATLEMPDLQTRTAFFRNWPGGIDSWTAPSAVNPLSYVWSQNILNKGGIPQTRPGSRALACMPSGRPQGIKLFTPRSGVPELMVAVDGKIWTARAPFDQFRQLTQLQFNPASRFVTITEALKSTAYDDIGEIYYLNDPFKVAVIQDGNTRSAYYDGSTAVHNNPTPTAKASLTQENRDGTKIGLWSVYSNNRLWVARGRFVFASDIGNPLKNKESQYINESPAFILPNDCTGMIEVNDRSGILCFYENGADFIESSIQDRTQWLDIGNIQQTVLEVGCVAPRSLIKHNGLVHWFSPKGWISMNEALRANLNSELNTLDDKMAYSKHRIGPDLTPICAGTFENIAIISVPFTSLSNTHTWVLDQAIVESERSPAWASTWTGWRPVEWTSGVVDDYERIFFLSADSDGNNRVWEAFLPDQKDNGCDITCSVQLRQEDFNTPDMLKKFRFAEIQLGQLAGTLDVMAAVAGSAGWFDRILTHEIVATYERVEYEQTYGNGITNPLLASSRKQSRVFRTEEWIEPSACNKCGIEGQQPVNWDYSFSLFIGWSGRAALTRVKLFAGEETENEERGLCPTDETGPNVVDGGGCSLNELNPVNIPVPFPKFLATSVQESTNVDGDEISWESSGFSHISQKDAQRRSDCKGFQQLLLNSEDPSPAILFPELVIYNEAGTELIIPPLDFGTVLEGEFADITLRLVNEGEADLVLEVPLTLVLGAVYTITHQPEKTIVEPGDWTFVTIRITAP